MTKVPSLLWSKDKMEKRGDGDKGPNVPLWNRTSCKETQVMLKKVGIGWALLGICFLLTGCPPQQQVRPPVAASADVRNVPMNPLPTAGVNQPSFPTAGNPPPGYPSPAYPGPGYPGPAYPVSPAPVVQPAGYPNASFSQPTFPQPVTTPMPPPNYGSGTPTPGPFGPGPASAPTSGSVYMPNAPQPAPAFPSGPSNGFGPPPADPRAFQVPPG